MINQGIVVIEIVRHIPRRRHDNPADAHGAEAGLGSRSPVLIVDIDSGGRSVPARDRHA